MLLYETFKNNISIVEYKPYHLIINQNESRDANIQVISTMLKKITKQKWTVEVNNYRKGIVYGIHENDLIEQDKIHLRNNKLVRKIMKDFPELKINDIKDL